MMSDLFEDAGQVLRTHLDAQEIEIISNDEHEYTRKCENLINGTASSSKCETLMNTVSSSKTDKIKWNTDNTKLLINLRLAREMEFNRPMVKKNRLWVDIAREIAEIACTEVSAENCHMKYRNLLQTYKSNKMKRLHSTGEAKISWEHFDTFDEVLGSKALTCPSPSLLMSSTTTKNQKSENLENISQNITEELVPQNSTKEKKKKKAAANEMTIEQYLFTKLEAEKERWNERKRLKELEIAAVKNVADAIRATEKAAANEMTIEQYLFTKLEAEKERWNERKRLKELKIAAVNNVADAIRATVSGDLKRKRGRDSPESH